MFCSLDKNDFASVAQIFAANKLVSFVVSWL